MREELKVKTGDKVLYSWWNLVENIERIETVTKVTRTGKIKVECGREFDKYGIEIGRNLNRIRANISIPTEEDYKRIKENSVIQNALYIIKRLNEKTLSYDKAVKIIRILEGDKENESNNRKIGIK